jgi:quinohemoprotein amine dehydrogenase
MLSKLLGSSWALRAAMMVGLSLQLASAQGRRGGGAASPPAEKPEEGIAVTNQLVIEKCGVCHTKDEKGNLSRISWERTTPEGWEEAIKRMVRLNGLQMAPAEARTILKYLSTYHGLAPEEAKPVMYMAERRIQDENIPNETIRGTCMNCHALGRVFSWRRTKEEWRLLTNLHSALYPQAESAFRSRMFAAPPAAGRGGAAAATAAGGAGGPAAGGGPLPVDETIDFLAKEYPLHTPAWSAWRARMRAPKIAGRWLVSAYITGRGKYIGEMVVEPGPADDEFVTRVKLQSIRGGPALSHAGTGLVYTGYSWRGRTKPSGMPAGAAPDDLSHEMRQVMWISPDQLSAEGRWFWGAYDEFGFDVKMERASDGPMLITTDRTMLKTGTTGNAVKILGDRLPADIAAADLDFGAGVTVKRIASHSASEVVAELDVAGDAMSGKRDVVFRRSVLPAAIAVYDRIDYIKVAPQSSLARLGSETHPKGFQQFEAVAFQRGEDGKNYTADDVELGAIDVTWKVEEFMAVYGDDDKDFVGTLNDSGFFTPASDGPNPKRKFSRNNYGDIWVVATAKNEKDKDGNPLVGRSYLVVTVPLYIRWDQPEVAQ